MEANPFVNQTHRLIFNRAMLRSYIFPEKNQLDQRSFSNCSISSGALNGDIDPNPLLIEMLAKNL
jgi:hypothetical protein